MCVVGDMTRCFREVVASTMPGLKRTNGLHNWIECDSVVDFVRKRVQGATHNDTQVCQLCVWPNTSEK